MTSSEVPRGTTPAEAIFVAWLADRSRDFAEVARAHPEHARELRSLFALWERLEPMLSLAGIRSSDAIERLTAPAGDDGAPVTPLDLASSAGASSNTSELLRRLEKKRRTARYRFDGEVARGGMGAILRVWDEDIRRHLAMKVVLGQAEGSKDTASLDSRLLARFLEEAQITGQLDHPGIVPVHELGLDADGRVYFTMKLVKGRDLAAIYELARAQKDGWSEARALGVLLKVCEAVAFAHAKGVIHRDLKPANVMVGDFGEVYVMDWGLARVLGRADTHARELAPDASSVRTERVQQREASPGSSILTLDGDIVGTPSYMPPEQARGDIESLSERSDVYALGAMLYHLLAGAAPYAVPGAKLGAAAVWERAIAGPPDPLETLAPRAPSELVAICEKAMARDPAARYPDMLALAGDLRAFLEGRVVGAFEGGALAEARKWVRRNKALAASLATAVLALAAGLVASLVLSRRVQENAALAEVRRVEAEHNASDARRQARVANEVNRFLNDDLLAAVAPEQLGIDVTVREVLDQASQRLEGRFADEPSVEAALRRTIGKSYVGLGEYAKARPHVERAVELLRASEGADGIDACGAAGLLAEIRGELGERAQAIELYQDTIARLERTLGAEHRETLSMRNGLAVVLLRDGQAGAARAIYEAILPIQARVLGPDDNETISSENNLALVDTQEGKYEDAVERHSAALARRRVSLGPKHPETLSSMSNLAVSLLDLGRVRECEELCREALALFREVKGPDHPHTGRVTSFLGLALVRGGRAAEAEPLFAEALRIDLATFGADHEATQQTRANLVSAYSALGRLEEAIAELRTVLESHVRLLGAEHVTTLVVKNQVATTLLAAGKAPEAETLLRELLETRKRTLGEDHPVTILTNENLSNALFGQKRLDESAQILREVLAARLRVLGESHPDVAKTTFNLGLVTKAAGDRVAGVALLEDALARMRALDDVEPPLLLGCLRAIGDARASTKEFEPALAAYREALEISRRIQPEPDSQQAFLMHQVANMLYALDRYTEALVAYDEAYPLRERFHGKDDAATRFTLFGRGRTLIGLERYAEAESALLDAHERAVRDVGPEHDNTKRTRSTLADLYERWGRPEDAAKWK